MKRILAVLLTVVLVCMLAACGAKSDKNNNDSPNPTASINTNTSEDVTSDKNTEDVSDNATSEEKKAALPEYKMAQIGADSRVSESKYGFHKTGLDSENAEGKTFYALSWVFEEKDFVKNNYNFYSFKIKDIKTGKFIEKDREHFILHEYRSTVYDTDEFEGTGIKYYGHAGKQMYTLVLYTDYEIKFDDIEVWATYDSVDYKLECNTELDNMTIAPKRATGYMFIKLKDSYYVSNASSSGGGTGGDCNYDIFDFISVKYPLTSIKKEDAILDPTKITFYDTETNQHLKTVPGTELYYEEKVESAEVDVHIGVITTDENILHNWSKRYRVFYNETTLL